MTRVWIDKHWTVVLSLGLSAVKAFAGVVNFFVFEATHSFDFALKSTVQQLFLDLLFKQMGGDFLIDRPIKVNHILQRLFHHSSPLETRRLSHRCTIFILIVLASPRGRVHTLSIITAIERFIVHKG
jgi:hypothetical protein